MESKPELYKALSKFQGEVKSAAMDKTNPHFKNRYATLKSVWDAVRSPLSKCGLSIVQMPEHHADGIALRTVLAHESGESIESTMVIPVMKKDAQGIGSALTYARRYGLSSMLGIVADEDDDGNVAVRNGNTAAVRQIEQGPDPEEAEQLRSCTSLDSLKAVWGRLATSLEKPLLARLAPVKDAMKAQIDAAARSEANHA